MLGRNGRRPRSVPSVTVAVSDPEQSLKLEQQRGHGGVEVGGVCAAGNALLQLRHATKPTEGSLSTLAIVTSPRPARLRVGVVGVGRVGGTLGAALARAGHDVVAVSAVSSASVARAEQLLPRRDDHAAGRGGHGVRARVARRARRRAALIGVGAGRGRRVAGRTARRAHLRGSRHRPCSILLLHVACWRSHCTR